jgi:uncharacterized protein YajQ (UPF0234 family)
MPSFDVVSKVAMNEVDNALNQANKELGQRFDFRGTNTSIKLAEQVMTVESADEFKLKAAVEVVREKLAKRKVPLEALDSGKIEPASSGRARQQITIRSGIDGEVAKKIVKHIKDTKLKVQAAIQGDSVRVSGKNRDDLQETIAKLREGNFGQPLQFENFRD